MERKEALSLREKRFKLTLSNIGIQLMQRQYFTPINANLSLVHPGN